MINLHEKIDVKRPVHEAFAYIADFRTTQEWDATAFAAVKLTPGPVALGTEYDTDGVAVALALGVNPILDMFETMNNVTGDVVCTHVVAENEGGAHALYGLWGDQQQQQSLQVETSASGGLIGATVGLVLAATAAGAAPPTGTPPAGMPVRAPSHP